MMTVLTQASHIFYNKGRFPIFRGVLEVTSSTHIEVVAAKANFLVLILSYNISAEAAANIVWEDSDGTQIGVEVRLGAKGTFHCGYNPLGHMDTAVGKGVRLNPTAATAIDADFVYAYVQ